MITNYSDVGVGALDMDGLGLDQSWAASSPTELPAARNATARAYAPVVFPKTVPRSQEGDYVGSAASRAHARELGRN